MQLSLGHSIANHAVHTILHRRLPQALWHGSAERHEIALTFDDGPHPQDTPELLDFLAQQQVRATFFHIGRRVEQYPDLVRQVAEAGHQIGIHGYRHRAFPLEPLATLHSHLDQTQSLIAHACQRDPATVNLVRPPFGLLLPSTLHALNQWGYRPVMWSVVPFHWLQSAQATIDQAQRQVTNGSLLVLHEGLAGPPLMTFAEPIIAHLKAEGYNFITVEQMEHSLDGSGAVPQ